MRKHIWIPAEIGHENRELKTELEKLHISDWYDAVLTLRMCGAPQNILLELLRHQDRVSQLVGQQSAIAAHNEALRHAQQLADAARRENEESVGVGREEKNR